LRKSTTCSSLISTGVNKVVRPTMNSIVNMLLQHCSTVTTWNNMVDNLFIVGRTTYCSRLSISTWNNLCVFSRVHGKKRSGWCNTDENRIEQCFAAHIVHSCQQYWTILLHPIQAQQHCSIDRFHSRDRWPQWGGETIRNIWIRKS
jgi:hypothetical protein